MQLTGTILTVQARIDNNTNAQMSWSAHGKTFYTFDMTVRGPNGDVSGEISSTSVGVYPKTVGSIITVDSFEQNGWPKLKAISDQQQGGQPQQQQQPYQQQPQQQAPPAQRPPQQQDSVQDRIAFAQAYNLANADHLKGIIKTEQMHERTKLHYKVLTTRQFPFEMSLSGPAEPAQQQTPPQQQAPPPQAPPAQDFNEPPFSPTDDIPF